MIQECVFDPVTDVQAVEQNGYVDLAKANAMSSVPADISADELSFNEIDDPNSIGGRPSDIFEAAQMNQSISSFKAPEDDSKE